MLAGKSQGAKIRRHGERRGHKRLGSLPQQSGGLLLGRLRRCGWGVRIDLYDIPCQQQEPMVIKTGHVEGRRTGRRVVVAVSATVVGQAEPLGISLSNEAIINATRAVVAPSMAARASSAY